LISFTFESPLSDGGMSITNYNVYEDDGDLIFSATPLVINSLSHSKTIVAPVLPETKGKVYSFKISACNFLGEGELSDVF